jgi:hypothetical protein
MPRARFLNEYVIFYRDLKKNVFEVKKITDEFYTPFYVLLNW